MADFRVSLAQLQPLVSEASQKFGVPEERIWNVIRAENSGSPEGASSLRDVSTTAVSPKNARGVMQVTPIALKDVQQAGLIPSGVSHDNLSVRDQIFTGTAYLSRLQELSQDDAEIYAMYNYGPKARFRMDSLPGETSGYLQKTGSSNSASSVSTVPSSRRGPMMDTNTLVNALLQTAMQQNQAMQTGAADVAATEQRASGMRASAIDQERANIVEQAAVAGEKIGAQYSADKMLEKLQGMFNMDPERVDNEIAASLAEVDAARKARAPVRAAYDKAASVGLLDDPLGYIFAQMELPKLAAQNNALADAEDNAIQNIQQRTAMLANAKATITANTADQIREAKLKQATVDAKVADAKLTVEEAKNVSGQAASKLQQINIANAIGDNTRQTLLGVASLMGQDEQRSAIAEQRALMNEAKQDAAAQEARLDVRLKLVSDSLGLPEAMTQKRLKLLAPKERDAWMDAALNGNFGKDLFSSLVFFEERSNRIGMESTGNASTMDTASKLKRHGASYQDTALRQAALTGKRMNAKDAQELGYTLYMNELVDSYANPREGSVDLSSNTWDTKYNPYIGSWTGFTRAIEANPDYAALKGNLIATAVKDLIGTGVVKGDNLDASQRQQAVLSVFKKVASREITSKKASADIAAYFQTLAKYNLDNTRYTAFALPPQTSYVFTIPGDIGIDRKKVDLMDPQGVESALVWRAKQRPFPKLQEVLKMLPFSPNMLTLPGEIGGALLRGTKEDNKDKE